MVRRRLLIVQVSLLAVLAILALPSSGSVLSAVFIELTPTGPSPADLRIPTGMHPVWQNQDTVAHTVVFADGCNGKRARTRRRPMRRRPVVERDRDQRAAPSFQVAPGAIGGLPAGRSRTMEMGNYAYTVDGNA